LAAQALLTLRKASEALRTQQPGAKPLASLEAALVRGLLYFHDFFMKF
jgi:hypothetical protein